MLTSGQRHTAASRRRRSVVGDDTNAKSTNTQTGFYSKPSQHKAPVLTANRGAGTHHRRSFMVSGSDGATLKNASDANNVQDKTATPKSPQKQSVQHQPATDSSIGNWILPRAIGLIEEKLNTVVEDSKKKILESAAESGLVGMQVRPLDGLDAGTQSMHLGSNGPLDAKLMHMQLRQTLAAAESQANRVSETGGKSDQYRTDILQQLDATTQEKDEQSESGHADQQQQLPNELQNLQEQQRQQAFATAMANVRARRGSVLEHRALLDPQVMQGTTRVLRKVEQQEQQRTKELRNERRMSMARQEHQGSTFTSVSKVTQENYVCSFPRISPHMIFLCISF